MARAGRPRYGRRAGADDEDSSVSVPATRIPYGSASGDGSLDSEADLNYDAATNTVRQGMAASLETIANGAQHTVSANRGGAGTFGTDSYGQVNLRRVDAGNAGYILGKLKAWLGSSSGGGLLWKTANVSGVVAGGIRAVLSAVGDGTGGTSAGSEFDAIEAYESGAVALGYIGAQLIATAVDGFVYIRDMAGRPANSAPASRGGQPITVDNIADSFWFYGSTSASWKKPNQDFVGEIAAPQTGNYSPQSTDYFIRYTGAGGHTFTLPVVATTWNIAWGPVGTQGKAYWIRNDGGGNLTLARGGVAEFINGAAADYTLAAGHAALIICAGSKDWWLQNVT